MNCRRKVSYRRSRFNGIAAAAENHPRNSRASSFFRSFFTVRTNKYFGGDDESAVRLELFYFMDTLQRVFYDFLWIKFFLFAADEILTPVEISVTFGFDFI